MALFFLKEFSILNDRTYIGIVLRLISKRGVDSPRSCN